MSGERIEASLEGYKSQVFPDGLDRLNIAYDGMSTLTCGKDLDEVGKKIDGYERWGRPTTSDGYGWLCGLYFEVRGERIAMLFPFMKDLDRRDNLRLSRSIAMYVQGEVELQEIDNLVERLIQDLPTYSRPLRPSWWVEANMALSRMPKW